MPESRLIAYARTAWRGLRARVLPVHVEHHQSFVVVDADDICRNPIFVIGTHRSGTTLLRRILDSHHNIACPPESHYLSHFFALIDDDLSLLGLAELGFPEDEALKLLRHSAGQFHEIYRRAKGKPRWADKTPEYSLHLPALQKLFGVDAQLLFVFRHPLDVAYSLWSRKWNLGAHRTGDLLVDVCRHVCDLGLAQLDFLERQPRNAHAVFYEELVRSPETVLRAACDYLGEEWDPQMLRHDEVPHDFGHEDPIARVTRGFQPSQGNWRQWSPQQLDVAASILQPIMSPLNYSRETSEHRAARAYARAA